MEVLFVTLGICVRVFGYVQGLRPSLRFLESPYTCLTNLQEGNYYIETGFFPYFEGSPVHSPPLVLGYFNAVSLSTFFFTIVCIELHSAWLIRTLTRSKTAFWLFYLNPFSVILTLNMSTSVLNIWSALIFVYFSEKGKKTPAALALAWVWYIDPSLGILSSVWYFKNRSFKIYFLSASWGFVLKLASDLITGPGWVQNCQFSSFFMYDIRPSFGLRWYLMLEMFNQYHLMYSVMIAVHTWVYIYPLISILDKFHRYSKYERINELYLSIIFAIIYINHPHPTLFEYFLVVCFFLQHEPIILKVKSAFFTVSSWVIGNLLSVVMWNVWIYRMGGNVNFLYFQTIFTNCVAIGFIVALLYQIVEDTHKCKVKIMCKELLVECVSKLVDS